MATLRLCFVGDSFVNGTGDPNCLGWTGRICQVRNHQGHDITYYNLGVRRETSADIAARWYAEVSCRLPGDCRTGVVFCFGINDTTLENGIVRVTVHESVNYAQQILNKARQYYPVLMISPPPIADADQNLRTIQLVESFAQICQSLTIPYLDIFTPLHASTVWMTEVSQTDGAHPRAAGYQLWADWVQQWQAWHDLFQ